MSLPSSLQHPRIVGTRAREGFRGAGISIASEREAFSLRRRVLCGNAPTAGNRVTLDPNQRDAWGIPVLHIDCRLDDAELTSGREQITALRELAEVAGVTLTHVDEAPPPPGSANHECGTARMGGDPKNSVLDPHNECWEAQGLFVTDGACFPSQGIQNPTFPFSTLTDFCESSLSCASVKFPAPGTSRSITYLGTAALLM